jgi:hypothetical protein
MAVFAKLGFGGQGAADRAHCERGQCPGRAIWLKAMAATEGLANELGGAVQKAFGAPFVAASPLCHGRTVAFSAPKRGLAPILHLFRSQPYV